MCKTQKGSIQRDYTHGELAIPFFFRWPRPRGHTTMANHTDATSPSRSIASEPRHAPRHPSREISRPPTPPTAATAASTSEAEAPGRRMAHSVQTTEPKGEVKSWEGKMVARLQTGPIRMSKTAPPAKSKLDELGPFLHSPRKDLRCKELYDRPPF